MIHAVETRERLVTVGRNEALTTVWEAFCRQCGTVLSEGWPTDAAAQNAGELVQIKASCGVTVSGR